MEDLRREIDSLKGKLYDTVSQNLKLLSIIEFSKGTNLIFSTDRNLKMVVQTIQDSIPSRNLSLFLCAGKDWKLYKRNGDRTDVDHVARFTLDNSIRDQKRLVMPGNDPLAVSLSGFLSGHYPETEPGDIVLFPLQNEDNAKLLGFFIVETMGGLLNSDELRLLEVCQRQVANLLQINYLYQLSNIDSLTGLYNRRFVESKLEYEVKRSKRRHYQLTLLLLDLDRFKEVNDVHGHLSGDQVLAATGEMLLSALREIDIASRFGGEEFLILLPDTGAKAAGKVAERLRENLEAMHFRTETGAEFGITGSIGIACFDHKTDNHYTSIVERADKALYEAKNNGRNRVIYHES